VDAVALEGDEGRGRLR